MHIFLLYIFVLDQILWNRSLLKISCREKWTFFCCEFWVNIGVAHLGSFEDLQVIVWRCFCLYWGCIIGCFFLVKTYVTLLGAFTLLNKLYDTYVKINLIVIERKMEQFSLCLQCFKRWNKSFVSWILLLGPKTKYFEIYICLNINFPRSRFELAIPDLQSAIAFGD